MTRKPRRLPERIQDILEAVRNIASDIGEVSNDEFLADGKTQRAVIESRSSSGRQATRSCSLTRRCRKRTQHCGNSTGMPTK